MKCSVCPAYCSDSENSGCLVLKRRIQNYKGCNFTEEQVLKGLDSWKKQTSEEEIKKYSFKVKVGD